MAQQEDAANGNGPERARRLDFAMRALGRTQVSIYYQTEDLVYQWGENVPAGLISGGLAGKTDADLFPWLAADRLTTVKQKVLSSGDPQRFELPINLDGEVRWFDLWIDPERDASGRIIGIFSTAIETTEQRRREVQLKNLLREVSHRSKNLLAIILSLASQTARSAKSIDGFVTAFSGRLQSISRAQDLVTDRDWRGALLSDLIERQVALFRGDRFRQVTVRGENPVLAPNASLYVGLALHELCAHAVRGGHIPTTGATIAVTARRVPDGSTERMLRLEWVEQGMEEETLADMDTLSLAFLEKVVPLAVDGTARIEAIPGGLHYTLDIAGAHIA